MNAPQYPAPPRSANWIAYPTLHTDPTPARAAAAPGMPAASPASAAYVLGVEEALTCPITLDIMKDPVIASDGRTYEREAIVKWLDLEKPSPFTGKKLEKGELTPNIALRGLLDLVAPAEAPTAPVPPSAPLAPAPSAPVPAPAPAAFAYPAVPPAPLGAGASAASAYPAVPPAPLGAGASAASEYPAVPTAPVPARALPLFKAPPSVPPSASDACGHAWPAQEQPVPSAPPWIEPVVAPAPPSPPAAASPRPRAPAAARPETLAVAGSIGGSITPSPASPSSAPAGRLVPRASSSSVSPAPQAAPLGSTPAGRLAPRASSSSSSVSSASSAQPSAPGSMPPSVAPRAAASRPVPGTPERLKQLTGSNDALHAEFEAVWAEYSHARHAFCRSGDAQLKAWQREQRAAEARVRAASGWFERRAPQAEAKRLVERVEQLDGVLRDLRKHMKSADLAQGSAADFEARRALLADVSGRLQSTGKQVLKQEGEEERKAEWLAKALHKGPDRDLALARARKASGRLEVAKPILAQLSGTQKR